MWVTFFWVYHIFAILSINRSNLIVNFFIPIAFDRVYQEDRASSTAASLLKFQPDDCSRASELQILYSNGGDDSDYDSIPVSQRISSSIQLMEKHPPRRSKWTRVSGPDRKSIFWWSEYYAHGFRNNFTFSSTHIHQSYHSQTIIKSACQMMIGKLFSVCHFLR